MNEEEKKAIKTMQHWIEHEKENKDKINKADELIEIQETVLNLLEKKDKIIDLTISFIAKIDIGEDICMNNLANTELCNEECSNCVECIKQYFERKIEQ